MAVSIDRAVRHALFVAAIGLSGYTAPALALEFGSMTVHSHLNQPLDATIVLDHLDASERASLDVGIAPSSMFQRFGIRRSSAVDRIDIDTRARDGGRQAVVHVTTDRPIDEPFVDFLLQVESGNGRALREYTAMLDPVGEGAPAAATSPVAPRSHRSNTPQPGTAAQAGASAYQVRSGDTLWSIAAAHAPAGSTVAQTMLAIYRANPSAFGDSMRALSQNARLDIPAAAVIQRIDAGTARAQLQKTKAAAAGADASQAGQAADDQTKLAASGEAPPSDLRDNQAEPDTTTATANNKAPETSSEFGRLSLPSDAPWPEPVAAGQAPGDTRQAGNTPGAAPTSTTAGGAAPEASRDVPTAAAAQDRNDKSPRDVAEAGSGGWLSLRNLLLLLVLLALIFVAARRLRERGYRPVALDRTDDESEYAEARAEAEVADEDEPAVTAPAAVGEAPRAPAPEPAQPPAQPHRPTDAPASATAPIATPDPAPDVNPRPRENVSDTGSAEMPAGSGAEENADLTARRGHRESAPSSDDRPLRFHPIASDQADYGLAAAPPRPATNEEIEALAFETQPLPETGQREHDLGAADEPGLAFDLDASDESRPGAAPADGEDTDAAAPVEDPYTLEMIDPGEFDLYDPPSRNAGPNDDDPKQSVAIRLDLARMYMDMGDSKAARELLADVRERGDEEQRRAAEQLFERIDA